jgi:dihydroorotate dehydrogenase
MELASPVGLAAGPAPNARWIDCFASLGYDLLTYKTVRDRAWRGFLLPNLLAVQGDFGRGFTVTEQFTGTITNSLGMPSMAPEAWTHDVRALVAKHGGKLLTVSVTATPSPSTPAEEVIRQFASLAQMVQALGAQGVELNLSCPNVHGRAEGELYADAELVGRIVDATRAAVGSRFPLFLKVGYLESYAALVQAANDDRVAYVAINAIRAPVRYPDGRSVFPDRGDAAGICGQAIQSHAVRAVTALAQLRRGGQQYHIVGVGGVIDEDSAVALLGAGADAIECATGALFDPALALRIKRRLLHDRLRR